MLYHTTLRLPIHPICHCHLFSCLFGAYRHCICCTAVSSCLPSVRSLSFVSSLGIIYLGPLRSALSRLFFHFFFVGIVALIKERIYGTHHPYWNQCQINTIHPYPITYITSRITYICVTSTFFSSQYLFVHALVRVTVQVYRYLAQPYCMRHATKSAYDIHR